MNTKRSLVLLSALILLLLGLSYSNHFNNGFQFDDQHTIIDNEYIRDIHNIPLFFTDLVTFGTMPGNRGYRPVLTTLNAIDYWFADGLDPFYFHRSIFFWYVVQLVLMFFFFRKIFEHSLEHKWNDFLALFAVGFYGLHAANAETINYIIMRSDSFSTLCIVAAFILYQNPLGKKWYLYLLPIIIGIGAKETTIVFGVLLFFYILFFEEKISIIEVFQLKKIGKVFNSLIKAGPAIVIPTSIFIWTQSNFLSDTDAVETAGQATEQFNYFITQWYIIAHYIGNFLLPLHLSVEHDFQIIDNILDRRVLFGLGLILSLVAIAIITSKKREQRPIAFGILWFFIALAPTSSFIPFYQITNDHRTFFPYIGLVISASWGIRLLILKYESSIQQSMLLKRGIPLFGLLILLLHANGTHLRNEVWSSDETLWYDATVKGPNNGRVMLNYGLSQMEKGEYEVALEYFTKAQELLPYWAHLHINMGILKNAMGDPEEAEKHFLNAIKYQPNVAESYYFYGRWLNKQNRNKEARDILKAGQKISPGQVRINNLLTYMSDQPDTNSQDELSSLLQLAEENPTAENFLNLSLVYYRKEMYQDCVDVCLKALAVEPDFVFAYNNMCIAYNALGEWEKAKQACERALEIIPNYPLAKNNLQMVLDNIAK